MMQFKIGICDDDIELRNNLENKIKDIYSKYEVTLEFYGYDNGEEFLNAVEGETGKFEIVFMDIDMPKISGLEVAKNLHEKFPETILIFVSAHEQYVYESFTYSPFRYIRKYRIDAELRLALDAAYEKLEIIQDRFIVVRTDDAQIRLNHSDIMYYETEGRKINIHMSNGCNYLISKTMKEFVEEMNDDNFIKIHSGGMVNCKFVQQYSNNDLTLDNGERLIVSRSGMKELKSGLTKYWGKG